MKWREMKGNVELLDMCMCIVFAFQLIRAKEVRIDIEVKRSEEKWREVMTCDVSPVAMFFVKRRALDGPFLDKNTGFRRAHRRAKFTFLIFFFLSKFAKKVKIEQN